MATNTYKCTVCKRETERVDNVYGLDNFAKCSITSGCRGKLRKTGRNLDNIRESFPKAEAGLDDYSKRNAFYQHKQDIASPNWIVTHALNCAPAVFVFVQNAQGKWVPFYDFESEPVSGTVTKLTFAKPTAGFAQFLPRSSSNLSKTTSTKKATELTQVSVGGSFVFALPKYITSPYGTYDLKYAMSDIKIEVIIEKPNQEEIWCFEKLFGMMDLSPWSGIDEILLAKRRNYYLKSKNILNFATFNNPDLTFADIPEGTRLRIVSVDYGNGISVPVESKGLLMLLSSSPFEFTDKLRNKMLDIGELAASGQYLTYSNGEFFVDSSLVEKTYPPIEAARKVGPVPPLPSPTPTPTVSPTISITPTNTVTPTVTRTATPTPTVTDSPTPLPSPLPIAPSPSAGETPTPTPTISVTPTITVTPTVSPVGTVTPTPTISVTPSVTATVTPTPTPTLTPTISVSASVTPTPTPTPSASGSGGDAFAANTQVLLRFDAANGATTFVEDYNRTVTPFGTPTHSTAQSVSGGSSGQFTSSNFSRLAIPYTPDMDPGTADFTWECSVYPTAAPTFGAMLFGTYSFGTFEGNTQNAGWTVSLMADRSISVGYGSNPTWVPLVASAASLVPLNAWSHIAAVRSNGVIKIYLNGVEVASATSTHNINVPKSNFWVASRYDNGAWSEQCSLTGYLDNIRVTNGVARYTANFTPATSAFGDSVGTDTHYGSVSSLLHFEGADASTTFTDQKGHVWTRTGTPEIDTAQFKFGASSIFLPGNGNYVDSAAHADFTIGSGDFTIECFVRPQAVDATRNIWDFRPVGSNGDYFHAGIQSGAPYIYINSAIRIQSPEALTANVWHHLAVCRVAGITRLFVNGVQKGASWVDTTNYLGNRLRIGDASATGNAFIGHMDELRLTKGVGRYPSSFTPPTAFPARSDTDAYAANVPSLLHFNGTNDSTVFTDVSGRQWTTGGAAKISTASSLFGGTSGLFSTGSYITTPHTSDLLFNTSNFTIEFLMNFTGKTGYQTIASKGYGNPGGWLIQTGNGDGRIIFYTWNSAGGIVTVATESTGTINVGQWYHIAIVRNGSTLTIYRNGVSVASGSISLPQTSMQQLVIGGGDASGTLTAASFTGYMDEFRITNGTARYTAAFTPPYKEIPITPTPTPTPTPSPSVGFNGDPYQGYVSSLLRFDGGEGVAEVYDETGIGWKAVGNAVLTGAQSKFGSSSLVLDGSGDYLSPIGFHTYQGSSSTPFDFGSGDFTIEAWIRPTTVSANQSIIANWYGVNASYCAFLFYVTSAAKLQLSYGVGASNVGTPSTTSISANVWTHVAVCRQGTTVSYYINGVKDATTYTLNGSLNVPPPWGASPHPVSIGCAGATGGPNTWFNGHIDELRVTKGVARYNATFAVPTAKVPYDLTYSTALTTGLVSYWELGESGTQWVDSHGTNHLESSTGMTTLTASKVGYASHSANSSQRLRRIVASGITGLDFTTGDFTIATWFKSTTSNQGLIGRWYGAGNQRQWCLTLEGGFAKFGISDAGSNSLLAATSYAGYNDGNWHYIVGWRDTANNSINVQVNNGPIYSTYFSGTTPLYSTTPSDLVFHALDGSPTYGGTCSLDQAGAWSRKLTADERTALYNGYNGRSYADLTFSDDTALATSIYSKLAYWYELDAPNYLAGEFHKDSKSGSITVDRGGNRNPRSADTLLGVNSGQSYASNYSRSEVTAMRGLGTVGFRCWLKTGTNTGERVLTLHGLNPNPEAAAGDSTNNVGWKYYIDTDSKPKLSWQYGTNTWETALASATATPTTGAITFLGFDRDTTAGNITHVRDGVRETAQAYTNAPSGGTGSSTYPFFGGIPDSGFGAQKTVVGMQRAMYFNAPLTAAEDKYLYNAGRGRTFAQLLADRDATDPYSANVVSLLHFNGWDGATTFPDAKGKTWTATGNAVISNAQSKFGNTSLRLDGTGDFLDCVGGTDFQFGTGDFTVEMWVQLSTASQDMMLLDSRFGGLTSSFALYDSNSSGGQCNVTFYSGSTNRASSASLTAGVWYHVALSRVSGQSRLFIDGQQVGSTYADTSNYSSTQLRLGHNYTATSSTISGLNGYIDEVRITKGIGRYTTNFAPPVTPFT